MSIVSLFSRARVLLDVPRMAKLIFGLYRDPRVASWMKIGPAAAAVLIISPLDIFSDIPLLGSIDDIALLIMLAQFFISVSPPAVVSELNGMGQRIPGVAAMRAVKNVTPAD